MPKNNRCMHMAHVCFMSVVATVRGLWDVCCITAFVKNNGFLTLEF